MTWTSVLTLPEAALSQQVSLWMTDPHPGLTAPSSAQTEAPAAGSPRRTTPLRPSSPPEICSFSSSSPSSPSSSCSPSLPPSCRLLLPRLLPHLCPCPSSLPSSFSSSSCLLQSLPGLPSSSSRSGRLEREMEGEAWRENKIGKTESKAKRNIQIWKSRQLFYCTYFDFKIIIIFVITIFVLSLRILLFLFCSLLHWWCKGLKNSGEYQREPCEKGKKGVQN